MSLAINRRRLSVACRPVVLASLAIVVIACESAEEKRMKTLAGTYVWEYETDPATDPCGCRAHERHAVTLKADGQWTMAHLAEMNGEAQPGAADSGSYRADSTSVTMGATEQGPAQRYTVKGDTLWAGDNGAAARTKEITSLDMPGGNSPGFLVRQH